MNVPQPLRRLLVAVSVLLTLLTLLGHAQTTATYEPQVGQEGKDVVWVPTPQPVVDKMLDMAKVTPSDFVMDLGSGDGRTVITAAKRGARAMGIEYNPQMVELSQQKAAEQKVTDRATFMKADLFETDLSKASVITMFLLPDINLKLRPKILDLKPGTRVVSNTFTMGEWDADETFTVTDGCSSYCTALLWIVPAKLQGTWKSAEGDLIVKQDFQNLLGTLNAAGKTTPITAGKITGNEVSFTVGDAKYTGHVAGNMIDGTIMAGGKSSAWHAMRATSAMQ